MRTKLKPTTKTIVYTIQFRVDASDAPNMEYIVENLRETGEAEITDVNVEEKENG
jgi:hypothetical protein